MNVRSVSGMINAPPDLIPHVTMRDTWDAPVTMVRTRVSQPSPRPCLVGDSSGVQAVKPRQPITSRYLSEATNQRPDRDKVRDRGLGHAADLMTVSR